MDWDSPIWRPWLTLLTRHHSLIYYDWRECGLSDRERVQFAPDRYVEDFEAVIEATNVNRFALVGMGLGTRMAMTYAVRHPEQISRLVLLGPSSCGRVVQSQNQEQAEEEATRLRAIELGWHDNNPAYGQFFTSNPATAYPSARASIASKKARCVAKSRRQIQAWSPKAIAGATPRMRATPYSRLLAAGDLSVPHGPPASATFFSLPPLSIRDGIARRLQLPSKLMAQHKFGTRRRAMLRFERQPFPAPCHVDQDVAHSRAWCALRHLTTFDRVLSALHRRNHLPVPPGPCTQPLLPQGSRCGQHLSRPEYTSRPIVTFAPQHTALRVRALRAGSIAGWISYDFKARSTSKR